MDYGRFLTTAGHITRRHKFLWLFGLLLSLEALSNSLFHLTIGSNPLAPFTTKLEQWQSQPDQLIGQVQQWWQKLNENLLNNFLIYLLTLLVIWFIVTLALSVIITTTLRADDQTPIHLSTILKQAQNLLLRFIALDTLIYFPLFLVLALIMITFAGTLIGTVMSAAQVEATTATILRPLLIGGLCLLPLTCLLIPLSLLTVLFRTLALRETAVHPTTIRHTMRRTWATLKSHAAAILILGLLLWGLQVIINLALRLLSSFFYSLATTPFTATTPPWQIAILLFECIILLIQAIAHAFTAVAWTVAYKEISNP